MYMVVIFSFPFFLVLVLLVFLWSSLCLVVTTFRPHQKRARHRNVVTTRHKDDHAQEHKQDKNKEEWKRKDHNHVHTETNTNMCTHIRVYVVLKTHAPRHTRKQTSTQNHNNMNKRADTRAPHIIHKSAHACKITSRHKERAFHLTRLMAAGPPSTLTSRSITLCRHTYSHCSNSF